MKDEDRQIGLEYASKIAAYASLGREDLAIATAREALVWSREVSSVFFEVAFLLQLLSYHWNTLFEDEALYYLDHLFTLVTTRTSDLIQYEDLKYLWPALDSMLRGSEPKFQAKWSPRLNEVLKQFNLTPATEADYSDEFILIVGEPLPDQFVKEFARLHEWIIQNESPPPQINLEQHLQNLRESLKQIKNISAVTRRVVRGEINYLEMCAGLKNRDLRLALRGAMHLFKQPRRFSQDEILAGSIFLRISRLLLTNSALLSSKYYNFYLIQSIRKIIFQSMKFLSGHALLRFLARDVARISPLIQEYFDLVAQRAYTQQQAIALVSLYQGFFYSRCINMRPDFHTGSYTIDVFTEEYKQLLNYIRKENANVTHAALHSDSPTRSLIELALSGDKESHSYQYSPSDFISLYQNVEFIITETTDESNEHQDIRLARSYLESGEFIFLYFHTRNFVYLIVTSTQLKPKIISLSLSASEILEHHNSIQERRTGTSFYLTSAEAYAWIYNDMIRPGIAYIRKALPKTNEIPKIIFIDSQLEIPFHLAYDSEEGKHLIENFIVSYSHSVGAFIFSREMRYSVTSEHIRVLLTGYEGDGSLGKPRLPHVAVELEQLKSLLSERITETEPISEFTRISGYSSDWTVFHFSGHITGAYSRHNWWTLHFADKSVSVSELLSILHEKVFLVSLLGCSSAEQVGSSLGEINGLAGALVAFGIPNVIGYLWPVPDAVASLMTRQFYRCWLFEGLPISSSLRVAMLNARYLWGPAVWGGLVYYGGD